MALEKDLETQTITVLPLFLFTHQNSAARPRRTTQTGYRAWRKEVGADQDTSWMASSHSAGRRYAFYLVGRVAIGDLLLLQTAIMTIIFRCPLVPN